MRRARRCTSAQGRRRVSRSSTGCLNAPRGSVSRSGVLHPQAPAHWHDIPRYESLDAALAAVSARWEALTIADLAAPVAEVVQFEDSATYPDEAPAWPSGPVDPVVGDDPRLHLDLTIQAAERERPVILVDPGAGWSAPAVGTHYRSITLVGIVLGGIGWTSATVPPAERVTLELCSVLEPELRFSDVRDGAHVDVAWCETAALALAGTGVLGIRDSIVDGPGSAIVVPEGRAELERVSVGGAVSVRVLEASEVIFADDVEVEDRFQGCVRFSRVTSESVLPQVHRTAVDVPVKVVSTNRLDASWWRLQPGLRPGDPARCRERIGDGGVQPAAVRRPDGGFRPPTRRSTRQRDSVPESSGSIEGNHARRLLPGSRTGSQAGTQLPTGAPADGPAAARQRRGRIRRRHARRGAGHGARSGVRSGKPGSRLPRHSRPTTGGVRRVVGRRAGDGRNAGRLGRLPDPLPRPLPSPVRARRRRHSGAADDPVVAAAPTGRGRTPGRPVVGTSSSPSRSSSTARP